MSNPMTDMEDDLHAVRQLIEAAMLLLNDLEGEDAERAYRVVVAAHDGQLAAIKNWTALREIRKAA